MSDDRINEEPGKLEEIKQENALLKMKLTAEFGMTDSGGNIDPEIENAWLKNIYEFEKAFAEHKGIKIYDYIGRPVYRNVSEIATEEVGTELTGTGFWSRGPRRRCCRTLGRWAAEPRTAPWKFTTW